MSGFDMYTMLTLMLTLTLQYYSRALCVCYESMSFVTACLAQCAHHHSVDDVAYVKKLDKQRYEKNSFNCHRTGKGFLGSLCLQIS